jgi:hypothetical protein
MDKYCVFFEVRTECTSIIYLDDLSSLCVMVAGCVSFEVGATCLDM